MKQLMKKLSASFLALVCIMAISVSGTSLVWAAEELDETTLTTLETYTTSLAEAIVELTDEDIETYKESNDEFTVNAMNAWEGVKDELGEVKEFGEVTSEFDDDTYTSTIPVSFEKQDADFVITYDEEFNPTDVTIDVQYSLATQMKNAALNTVMGLGTVFVVLALLIFLISLFKYIPGSGVQKKKTEPVKTSPAAAPAPAPAATSAPVQPAQPDNSELIAVIAAAIAAAEGTTTDGFVVRSIRKVKRPRH